MHTNTVMMAWNTPGSYCNSIALPCEFAYFFFKKQAGPWNIHESLLIFSQFTVFSDQKYLVSAVEVNFNGKWKLAIQEAIWQS